MAENKNINEQLFKEEMAKKISGSVMTKSNEDIKTAEQKRRDSGATYPERRYAAPKAQQPTANLKRKSASAKKRKKAEMEAKRRKKKCRQRTLIACLVVFVLLIGGAITGTVMWYQSGKALYDGVFLDNTYINDTDVSGKTAEEAAELVRQDSDIPDSITIITPDDETVMIKMTSLDGEDNIVNSVEDFYNGQDHAGWYKSRTEETHYTFTVKYDYDRELLYDAVYEKIVANQDEAVEPENAYIQRTDDGFEIVDEVIGTVIDEDKVEDLYDFIDGFLDRGDYSISLKNCNCYKSAEVTADDLAEELEKLNSLYNVEFTFDFTYTTETLSGSEVIDWITFENDNALDGYTVDEDKAMEYVEKLADEYDTYGKDRTFNSTTRGEITVEQGSGCYGWWIDQEKTCALLVGLIEDGISATTEPYYYVNPNSQYTYTCNANVRTADDDIGDTYCEVDLEEQHFWYYKDGELEYECDIVSGKPTEERNTPAGVYKLWYKELNKTLTGSNSAGETWSTPVTYWNNISTIGIGLHDATWQSSFGGTRYVNYGSHGCINMPYNAAKYVYENVELDTPVIMYW
ncbi:MAG: L,D-transpeptidase/peptidoglycan binding protein [Ruminococcus sp.]|nr:L,D-transpeptidase/peptidoglycan binding protein [Ruminococcus sp.]